MIGSCLKNPDAFLARFLLYQEKTDGKIGIWGAHCSHEFAEVLTTHYEDHPQLDKVKKELESDDPPYGMYCLYNEETKTLDRLPLTQEAFVVFWQRIYAVSVRVLSVSRSPSRS
jgi:hypothetical protein